MKLTFSKLDTYRRCPLRFRLRYHERLPEAPRGRHSLSLVLHRTLEAFLKQARRDSSLESLLRTFEGYWPSAGSPRHDQYSHEGRRALEAFHQREGRRLARAVALEQDFSVSLAGAQLTGRLDCALETEAGLELVDFKFTRQVPPEPDPLQLQLYALGLRELTRQAPDTLTYDYLRQGWKHSFPGGEAALEAGRAQVEELSQQLRAEQAFAPRPGPWCETCSYRRYCPAQRTHPERVPTSPVQASLPL